MPDLQRVDELGFADFVAMLLVETLDAIVASHTSQEERLRALTNAAEQTVEEFTASITDEILSAALVQLFPDGDGGTAVAVGTPPPSQDNLDVLGITLRKGDAKGEPGTKEYLLTAAGVQRITDGVRTHLAQTNLESIRRVALEGVPRVRVDGGVLRSKLTFSAMRREDSAGEANRPTSGPALIGRSTIGDLALLTNAPRLTYVPVVQKGLLDSIASTRLTVSPALAKPPTGEGSGGSSEQESNATIYGEVEIHFHTEA